MRYFLSIVIVGVGLITGGCSYLIPFCIQNFSAEPITVSYRLKDPRETGERLDPKVVGRNGVEIEREFLESPKGLQVDRANNSVEFALLPGEMVEFFRVPAMLEQNYEKDLNFATLRLATTNGAVLYEGEAVLKSFRVVKRKWYSFGPGIEGFTLEFR